MTAALDPATIGTARRWSMLGASVAAQAGASVAINGPAFLIPTWQSERGLSLAAAGTLATMPVAGVMLSLFAWGLLVDRWGERRVMLLGLAGTTVAGVAATRATSVWALGAALLVVGLFAASTSSASGRIVVGWFAPERRGLAMGVRQMAQPLGVAMAAASMALTASRAGVEAATWIPVGATAVALLVVAVLVLDPPRPRRTPELSANPYRVDSFLARVHGVSVLLVVPQFLVWTYSLTWLVTERGWSPGAAGALVASTHVLGALGRIAVGHLSDVVGSRVRPLRWVSVAAGLSMGALALVEPLGVAVVVLVLASMVTVADNGLAFTGVAERAGAYWSGRALGVQNTAQYVAAAAVAPVAGLALTHVGYAATFAVAALFPLAAIPLVPGSDARQVTAR
ncbi:Sugar phosphate permease [Nocardioides scoriae]|uniref:Sugar phosphate permease n=1 Tax=Nocardioides scoriae TaxID=642780 RepID=A0A1H1WFM1_9ACTN|nr:MFS transporter [Nocardioides scoriae]SDS95874.1 Sugar phosphate permease [Nocardioides scoriae]